MEKVWKISLEVDELDLKELLCSSTPLGIFYNSLLYLAFLSNFKVLKKKENYASFLQNKRVWKGELWWGPNYTAEEEKEVCLSDVWSYSSFFFPCYLFFAGESKNPIFKVEYLTEWQKVARIKIATLCWCFDIWTTVCLLILELFPTRMTLISDRMFIK